MLIKETCKLLKQELLDNGYEYGFYLNGKTYKPDMTKDFDKEFFDHLLTEYCIQDPKDTMKAKVGTCNDAVVLMRYILDKRNIPSKIWLLHDKQSRKQHTVAHHTPHEAAFRDFFTAVGQVGTHGGFAACGDDHHLARVLMRTNLIQNLQEILQRHVIFLGEHTTIGATMAAIEVAA